MKKSKTVVLITDRDKKLGHYLFQNKIANIAQIHRDIFPNTSLPSIYRRLSKLKSIGFIHKITYYDHNTPFLACTAGPTYLKMFAGSISRDHAFKNQSDSIAHDLALNDIRIELEKCQMIDVYLTENDLYTDGQQTDGIESILSFGIRPDSLAKIKVPNSKSIWLPVEYEASLKAYPRSFKKLEAYYLNLSIEAVLFISKTPSIEKRFKSIDEKLRGSSMPKIYFCLLDKILSGKKPFTFTNTKGDSLMLS